MKGIIVGTSLFKSNLLNDAEEVMCSTEYGAVPLAKIKNTFLVNRHHGNIPPHSINHKANITALKKQGVTEIIGISSVGSLKKEINPGTFVVPDDYINFNHTTFFDNEIKHITPCLDEKIRQELVDATKQLGLSVITNGTCWQSKGPRLETPAEVRMIANYADVVGMTTASEATLASEAGVKYASLCSVDNYANGIMGTFTYEQLMETVQENNETMEKVIKKLMEL